MDDDASPLGRRLQEIRAWRGLSQRAVAELAGFSESYLSLIERGKRVVDRRSTLEALAMALRVAPSEITGSPVMAGAAAEGHAALAPLRLALADAEIGEPVDIERPDWPELVGRLRGFNALRPAANYSVMGQLLPNLISDLHASLEGPYRREALKGLVDTYSAAQAMAKNLGAIDLAQVASHHVRDVTAALSGPEWSGLAAWARSQAIGSTTRDRALSVAARGANEIASDINNPIVADVYGSLHLTAALASITLGRFDDGAAHIAEAKETAERPGVGTGFGHLVFCSGNVEIWRTLLAVETGEGGRAIEIARSVDPAILPSSASRRAAWWADIGRGLAMERRTRDEAVRAFRTAEELAPQRVRANPFVKEVVVDLLRRAKRDAGGRELRGLAYRMGITAG